MFILTESTGPALRMGMGESADSWRANTYWCSFCFLMIRIITQVTTVDSPQVKEGFP